MDDEAVDFPDPVRAVFEGFNEIGSILLMIELVALKLSSFPVLRTVDLDVVLSTDFFGCSTVFTVAVFVVVVPDVFDETTSLLSVKSITSSVFDFIVDSCLVAASIVS